MTRRAEPEFLKELEPPLLAELPVHLRFARSQMETALLGKPPVRSSLERSLNHLVRPFHKPISKPLTSMRRSERE